MARPDPLLFFTVSPFTLLPLEFRSAAVQLTNDEMNPYFKYLFKLTRESFNVIQINNAISY